MQNPAPLYYCPEGTARPPHIRPNCPAQRLMPDVAPKGCDMAPGGMCYGGDLASARGQWRVLPGTSWATLLPPDIKPWDLFRIDALDGPECGPWVLPMIMRSNGTLIVTQMARFDDDGCLSWAPPPQLASIVDGLRGLLGDSERDIVEAAMDNVHLVVDILALNYHINLAELVELGWLSSDLAEAVVRAALCIPFDLSADAVVDEGSGDA
jgi:hypothetical protein